ncbi:SDR family oxidoreductase [Runella sp. CRIBMP]|uniref:SDR family NAD(P)-dependent oxidoreductase n=1 Tax=Runella sp. CRIBMP TaxID=2683261 RepID=UPI001411FD9B|nr:SDR family NAD(P)-dependent oxidoreductase [Runella sp. CRIBMP]NBB19859.1 SDR family oxidoreductase [Runella sp. CRIBMP]
MNEFSGQVALVTGAASGIGLVVAHKLLDEGAQVALLDFNEKGLQQEFESYGDRVLVIGIDITDEARVQEVIGQALAHFGKIDILVNCVGITGITNLKSHEVSSENLHKVFEVNFMSCFYTSKAVLPSMMAQKYGRILHIASIAGKEGNAGMLAYSSSKAAVIGLTKVQGKEYAEYGITVNALAPAVIQTPLVDAMPEVQVKYMTDKIPMKRCGTLDEAANLVAYIVSSKNSFTTGFTFDLSGGRATY